MLQANGHEMSSIRCVISSASLGRADYVSIVLQNLYNAPPKVAWARREDVVVLQQGIDGDELDALLSVYVKEHLPNCIVVEFDNRGTRETLSLKTEVLATL